MYKITVLSKIKPHSDAVYQLGVVKTDQAFKGYAVSYKVGKIERKDPILQLEVNKSSIKDLSNDILNETKGFKYQVTLKVVLKNTNHMEKLNLDRFILIQKQIQ